jgi:hypothetical protein
LQGSSISQGNYRAGTTDSEGAVVRIDLHVHSEDSYDGHESVELVLEHASTIELDGGRRRPERPPPPVKKRREEAGPLLHGSREGGPIAGWGKTTSTG